MIINQKTRIVAVTGTKGKTSVVRAIHYAVQAVHQEPVLRVDTHKIVLGEAAVSTFRESVALSGLVPSVSPGRFLNYLSGASDPIAILEASLGSGGPSGLGYRSHQVGIFTNIYDDHIGNRPFLQTREDLAERKSFIFSSIKKNGFAVYNADDPLVVSQLPKIKPDRNITKVAVTLGGAQTNDADYTVLARDDHIEVCGKGEIVATANILNAPWLLGGQHEPTLYNALSVVAGLWALFAGDMAKFEAAIDALRSYQPDAKGGRMVVRTADNGATVILDFAHEAVSLSQVADYARALNKEGRVIGVVRLSAERNDNHIIHTTEQFAPRYDELFIYDKDEGATLAGGRQIGDVSRLMQQAATAKGVKSGIISEEGDALRAAYRASNAGDVIVYIISTSAGTYELADSVFHFKETTA